VLGAGALALTDSLTLLYGHRYFHEAAAAEAERARVQEKAFAVALAQLDVVPQINAERGYGAGDTHLRAAARVLSRSAVKLGATACRENGVVLAVLVPTTREVTTEEVCDELKSALADFGPVSIGAAEWRPGDDGETVIARAREALAGAPA
jgi:diguanylate cyclase (GGDEF)-like protein